MADLFEQLVQKDVAKKRERFELILDAAEQVKPDSDFVESCWAYYHRTGHLTEKQIEALTIVADNDDVDVYGTYDEY
jgi:hypothetical protein